MVRGGYQAGPEINPNQPDITNLPCRAPWLNMGSETIHFMELPNPDPKTGLP
ncbi:hypothetical protein BDL97_04G050200 [Sphagnum fallax]|nr:hypothetical protein BDL97_04G050200 [Sphagnum fallax]